MTDASNNNRDMEEKIIPVKDLYKIYKERCRKHYLDPKSREDWEELMENTFNLKDNTKIHNQGLTRIYENVVVKEFEDEKYISVRHPENVNKIQTPEKKCGFFADNKDRDIKHIFVCQDEGRKEDLFEMMMCRDDIDYVDNIESGDPAKTIESWIKGSYINIEDIEFGEKVGSNFPLSNEAVDYLKELFENNEIDSNTTVYELFDINEQITTDGKRIEIGCYDEEDELPMSIKTKWLLRRVAKPARELLDNDETEVETPDLVKGKDPDDYTEEEIDDVVKRSTTSKNTQNDKDFSDIEIEDDMSFGDKDRNEKELNKKTERKKFKKKTKGSTAEPSSNGHIVDGEEDIKPETSFGYEEEIWKAIDNKQFGAIQELAESMGIEHNDPYKGPEELKREIYDRLNKKELMEFAKRKGKSVDEILVAT